MMGKMEKLFYIKTIDFLTKDTFILTCINPVIFPFFGITLCFTDEHTSDNCWMFLWVCEFNLHIQKNTRVLVLVSINQYSKGFKNIYMLLYLLS